MFPEYRDLIHRLKTEDAHFHHLFEKHHELDHKITNMETHVIHGTHEEIEELKKKNCISKINCMRCWLKHQLRSSQNKNPSRMGYQMGLGLLRLVFL